MLIMGSPNLGQGMLAGFGSPNLGDGIFDTIGAGFTSAENAITGVISDPSSIGTGVANIQQYCVNNPMQPGCPQYCAQYPNSYSCNPTVYCSQNPSDTGNCGTPTQNNCGWFGGIFGDTNCSSSGSNGNGTNNTSSGSSDTSSYVNALAKVATSVIAAGSAQPLPVIQPWYSTPAGLGIIIVGLGAVYFLMKD